MSSTNIWYRCFKHSGDPINIRPTKVRFEGCDVDDLLKAIKEEQKDKPDFTPVAPDQLLLWMPNNSTMFDEAKSVNFNQERGAGTITLLSPKKALADVNLMDQTLLVQLPGTLIVL